MYQAHGKMFNIFDYQESVKQIHSEIPPHTCLNGLTREYKKEITNGEMSGREPLYTVSGTMNWYSHYGRGKQSLKKIKTRTKYYLLYHK